MTYTVAWTPTAQDDLAAVWLAASDRNAVTNASHEIDRLLKNDPETQGTPSFDTVRTLIVPPLAVEFEVVEDDRIVYVLTVWDATAGSTP
jgi:plasmid stabilization system protein ParE